ncbi:DUF5131 family protein [Saccharothrix sp. HUAS TT1]|uniref:DUF5131 family protein n=1 Tax=unclassified Saccharothrix TaxID=2593673 RepID=UPI00345BD71B
MGLTPISWAGQTWNYPASGCTKVSEGCRFCYIEKTTPFRVQHIRFDDPGDGRMVGATTGVTIHPDRQLAPFGVAEPTRWFVNSMSDLYHREIGVEWIARAFAVMAMTPHHTYLTLTKRPARQRALLRSHRFVALVARMMGELAAVRKVAKGIAAGRYRTDLVWPLRNLHVGVSVEDRKSADERLPALLDTPGEVLWASFEPLLEEVDLADVRHREGEPALDVFGRGLAWGVIGGESGALDVVRGMEQAWADRLLAQYAAAGAPVFYKQTGTVLARQWGLKDRKGEDPAEWPHPYPRQYPHLALAS